MESKLYKRKKEIFEKEFVIVGTGDLGPTNAFVSVYNEKEVESIFGRKGTLYKSYMQIKDTIPSHVNVTMIKTTGAHAVAYFNLNSKNGEIQSDTLVLTSIYSNQLYNNVKIHAYEDRLEFDFSSYLNMENAKYYYKDYEVVGQLVNAINEDTYNAKNVVIANCSINEYTPFDSSFYIINETTRNMVGGNSGLDVTKEELYMCLEKTYDIMLGEEIHLLTVTNAFLDDEINLTYQSGRKCTFYEQLLKFLATQLKYGTVTTGFITFSPNIKVDKDVVGKIKLVLNKCRSNENLSKYSFLISIPFGELYYDNKYDYSNPLMFYSSLYLNLEPNSNTTNKYLNDTYNIKEYLDYEQIKALNEIGVVTFRHSPYFDKVVACNGVTSVTYQSEFKYIVNVSMVQTVMPVMKKELENHLGENLKTVAESNIIKEDVRKVLASFTSKEIIDKYQFDLSIDYEMCELICNLHLKTAYMVEDIEMVGKIKLEQLEEV